MTDNIRKLVRPGTVEEVLDFASRTPGTKAVVLIMQDKDDVFDAFWSQQTLSSVAYALRVAGVQLDMIMRGEREP